MNRIPFLVIFLTAIAISACNENLKGPAAKAPLLPGNADVQLKRGDLSISTTHFDNSSASNYFRCHKNPGDNNLYYFEARRFVMNADNSLVARSIELFFPVDKSTLAGVQAEWSGNSVTIDGKMPPYKSLGAILLGKCEANLHLVGMTLSGSIVCHEFQNTDAGSDSIGTYDLHVSNLQCVID